MKHAKEKRFFAHHEKLRNLVSQLQDDLVNSKFKPQDMPAAVLRLEKLYMKLLREDWHTLQTGSKVAYVPSDTYAGLSEGNLTMRPAALTFYNEFFNKAVVDESRNRDLQKYVPEMKDFENYLQFKANMLQFMGAVLGVLASALAISGSSQSIVYTRFTHKWETKYPESLLKIRNIFKDVNYNMREFEGKSDEFIVDKYKKLTGLILDEKKQRENQLYGKLAKMIREIKFVEPVTVNNVMDPTSLRA